LTAAAIYRSEAAICSSRWRRSAISSTLAASKALTGRQRLQEPLGGIGADFGADPAGYQVAEDRVQPAGGCVTQPAQVVVRFAHTRTTLT
jgi:hypothetical protein